VRREFRLLLQLADTAEKGEQYNALNASIASNSFSKAPMDNAHPSTY